jgi:hypothetical protein
LDPVCVAVACARYPSNIYSFVQRTMRTPRPLRQSPRWGGELSRPSRTASRYEPLVGRLPCREPEGRICGAHLESTCAVTLSDPTIASSE